MNDYLERAEALWEGPEENELFRTAQLTLLFEVAAGANCKMPNIDRIAYYDFLSANPFALFDGENEERDAGERLTLHLLGFTRGQISYSAVGNRFVSRRQRIRHDLAVLIAKGLVSIDADSYSITGRGISASARLSVYADAYRGAAGIVLKRFGRLSELALRKKVESLLGKSWLLIDFLDDVRDLAPESSVK